MRIHKDLVSIASLFSSFSTLLCCALPSLFVAIGLGAVVAGVFSGTPWLQAAVKHHNILFVTASLVLTFNGWLLFRKKSGRACLPDKNTGGSRGLSLGTPRGVRKETACETAHRWNFWIFWASVGLFATGVTVTYVLPAIVF